MDPSTVSSAVTTHSQHRHTSIASLQAARSLKMSLSVDEILSKKESYFASLKKDDLLRTLMTMIHHVKSDDKPSSAEGTSTVGKKRTIGEAQAAEATSVKDTVAILRNSIPKQIRGTFQWRTRQKWKYEGICPSDAVFKSLMNTDVVWVKKRFTAEEFCRQLGVPFIMQGMCYRYVGIIDNVMVTWTPANKKLLITGKYGRLPDEFAHAMLVAAGQR